MGGPVPGIQDFAAVAGFYSQLAAVLAGFAFASIIALVAAELNAKNSAAFALSSLQPLVASFVALVGTSLNYAIVSGETSHTSRAAALETAAGLGFAVAGAMLLYSILVLMRGLEADLAGTTDLARKLSNLLRNTIVFGISPLLTVLLYGGVVDHETIVYEHNPGYHGYHGLDLAALIFALANLTVGVFAVLRHRKDAGSATGGGSLLSLLSGATVVIALMSVSFSTLILIFMSGSARQWDIVPFSEMAILATFTAILSISAVRYRAPVAPQANPPARVVCSSAIEEQ